MYVVAVVSEKGGVGKTTIALDLAVAAVRSGWLAAILDVNPQQGSASKWTDRRTAETPWVVPTLAVDLGVALERAEAEGVDLVVIDTPPHWIALPPHWGTEAAAAVRLADYVLVPVEPHMFSMETIGKAIDLLQREGAPPASFVINKAPTRGTEAATALNYITGQGCVACPVILHFRAAHRHASNVGLVAAEIDANSKAATEAQELYNYVLQALEKDKNGKA